SRRRYATKNMRLSCKDPGNDSLTIGLLTRGHIQLKTAIQRFSVACNDNEQADRKMRTEKKD
ncbi:MAG: hypothetical protein ACREEM_30465, partial [Blastocatellia bacterium]